MPTKLEGKYEARGLRIGIVAARFNDFIVNKLVDGALDAIARHGGNLDDVAIAWVPGSFEIPGMAGRFVASNRFDAVVCLGCVIRGGTDHYVHVAGEAIRGIAKIAFESPIPVIMGVLTTDSIEQAVERAGTKMGNKGADAALAAIEMVNLSAAFDKFLSPE